MGRNSYHFDGGEELTTLGAAWFISYSWYDKFDKGHMNWRRVSTYKNRISVYDRTRHYHSYWIKQIICMNENKLDTNTLGLSGYEIISMAKKML